MDEISWEPVLIHQILIGFEWIREITITFIIYFRKGGSSNIEISIGKIFLIKFKSGYDGDIKQG